jgi:hypothetical protein
MSPCTAVLVLVGSYLMVPPVNEPPSMLDQLDAQEGTLQESTLGKTSILRDAPLFALCEQERRNFACVASAVKDPDAETQSGAFARCVGTDEPRLQEK